MYTVITMASCSGQNIWRKVLDESLLADLIAGLDKGFSKTKWRDLGLRLGLKKQSLEEIAYNYRDDISMCLTECLSNWLKKQDDVDSRGGPTLNSLIDALKRIGENAVAEKMSTKGILIISCIAIAIYTYRTTGFVDNSTSLPSTTKLTSSSS